MEAHIITEDILLLTMDVILTCSKDLLFIKDTNLTYVGASKAFLKMVGLKNNESIVGKTDFDIFPKDLARAYTNDDKLVINSGVSIIEHVEPLPGKNGQKSYSSTSKHLLRNKNGNIVGLFGVGRDITMQIELEEEKERTALSGQMFDDVLEADITLNKMIRVDGSAWTSTIKLNADASFSDAVSMVADKLIHPEYAQELRDLYNIENLFKSYNEGKRQFSHISYQSIDGENYKWMEFSSRIYYSKISQTLRLVSFLRDLDEEVRNKEKLIISAETDGLTGLLNRRSIMEQIEKYISTEGADASHALLFVDLDYFKQVNDNYGHLFGDKILLETASRLKNIFRGNDLVGRVGGDEFLVLMKDISAPEKLESKTREIFERIPYDYKDNLVEVYVTCSVGVTLFSGNGKSIEEVYEEADKAMYRAKESGRNCLAFFE